MAFPIQSEPRCTPNSQARFNQKPVVVRLGPEHFKTSGRNSLEAALPES